MYLSGSIPLLFYSQSDSGNYCATYAKRLFFSFFSVPFILYDKLNELIVIWFEYNWCVRPSVCLAIGICVLRSLSFPFPLIELIVFLGPVKTSQTNSTICNMDVSIYFVAVLFVYACLLFSQKLIERVFLRNRCATIWLTQSVFVPFQNLNSKMVQMAHVVCGCRLNAWSNDTENKSKQNTPMNIQRAERS